MGCNQITSNSDKNRNTNRNTNSRQSLSQIPFDPEKFKAEALERHNYYRSIHHSPPLTISPELSKYAQDYANEIAKKNIENEHSECMLKDKLLGENLFTCINYITGKEMTDEFYREIVNYDFFKGECEPKAARFTQLVWKDTKEVGFGVAKNEQTGKYFAVVNYYPNGNGLGQFKNNVENK